MFVFVNVPIIYKKDQEEGKIPAFLQFLDS